MLRQQPIKRYVKQEQLEQYRRDRERIDKFKEKERELREEIRETQKAKSKYKTKDFSVGDIISIDKAKTLANKKINRAKITHVKDHAVAILILDAPEIKENVLKDKFYRAVVSEQDVTNIIKKAPKPRKVKTR